MSESPVLSGTHTSWNTKITASWLVYWTRICPTKISLPLIIHSFIHRSLAREEEEEEEEEVVHVRGKWPQECHGCHHSLAAGGPGPGRVPAGNEEVLGQASSLGRLAWPLPHASSTPPPRCLYHANTAEGRHTYWGTEGISYTCTCMRLRELVYLHAVYAHARKPADTHTYTCA